MPVPVPVPEQEPVPVPEQLQVPEPEPEQEQVQVPEQEQEQEQTGRKRGSRRLAVEEAYANKRLRQTFVCLCEKDFETETLLNSHIGYYNGRPNGVVHVHKK